MNNQTQADLGQSFQWLNNKSNLHACILNFTFWKPSKTYHSSLFDNDGKNTTAKKQTELKESKPY